MTYERLILKDPEPESIIDNFYPVIIPIIENIQNSKKEKSKSLNGIILIEDVNNRYLSSNIPTEIIRKYSEEGGDLVFIDKTIKKSDSAITKCYISVINKQDIDFCASLYIIDNKYINKHLEEIKKSKIETSIITPIFTIDVIINRTQDFQKELSQETAQDLTYSAILLNRYLGVKESYLHEKFVGSEYINVTKEISENIKNRQTKYNKKV